MKLSIKTLFLFWFLVLFSPDPLYSARGHYYPGDWISYSVFRFITCIAKDFEHIYFGTTGGVTRYHIYQKSWELPFTTSDGLLDNRIRKIAYDPSIDELWFDTPSGASVYSPIFEEWYYGGGFPDSLVKNKNDKNPKPPFPQLLMEFGYAFYPEGYITDLKLNRYQVTDYLLDDWDNLWIGTWGLNAGVADLRYSELEMFKYGLYQKDVKAIILDGDHIWFGGKRLYPFENGITRFDRKEKSWDYFEEQKTSGLESAQINVIEADSDYVWFGTDFGLARYDKEKNLFRFYDTFNGLRDDRITSLRSDGQILWIGTGSGLNFFWLKKDSIGTIEDPLVKNVHINTIDVEKNYLWVGTDWGVFRMNKNNGEWFRFSTPDGMLNSQINHILKQEDMLWFTTSYGILGYNTQTGEREIIRGGFDFPGNDPKKLVCDDRNIWVATYYGVWKMDRNTKVWRLYTTEDGLLDDDVCDLVLDKDYIWFGTPEGATRFFWNNPKRID